MTPELRAWAAENAPGVDADAELAKLKDHTFASARSDWAGTLRNWLRKAQEDAEARSQRSTRAAGAASSHAPEPEWRRDQRERNEAALGPFAASRRKAGNVIDITPTEANDAPPIALG
jgi:hypothetical protein